MVFFYLGLAKLIDVSAGVNGAIIATSEKYRFDLYINLVLIIKLIILEHAEDGAHASPDIVTGDSGNAHDGTRAHYNCVTCRSIEGLRMADVESRHSVH